MQALVGIIMGSKSDWETLIHTAQTLDTLGVPHEVRVVSAHRTPDLLFDYAGSAEGRGLEVIIAGAGDAAFANARARADPLIRGVDHSFQGIIVEDLRGSEASPASNGRFFEHDRFQPFLTRGFNLRNLTH